MLFNSENVKISIKNNRSSVKILSAKPEDAGTYVCKAVSDVGEVTTKAKLYCIPSDMTPEEREAFESQIRDEAEEEKENKEIKVKKKKRVIKKKKSKDLEEKRGSVQETEAVPETDETKELTPKPVEEGVADTKLEVAEPVEVTAVATQKKIEEKVEELKSEVEIAKIIEEYKEPIEVTEARAEEVARELEPLKERLRRMAKILRPVQEPVTVTETRSEVDVTTLKQQQTVTRTAKASRTTQEAISVSQVTTEGSTEELVVPKKTLRRAQPVIDKRFAVEVEELMKLVNAEEFGPGKQPLKEIAKVGIMLSSGVSTEEVVTQFTTASFPALRTPIAQAAMVSLVEREGHSSLISQVFEQETTTEQIMTGVFRAFLSFIELKHTTVEEILTLFSPSDFQSEPWQQEQIAMASTEDRKLETVKVTTQESKKVSRKGTKIVRHDETEETVTTTITREQEFEETTDIDHEGEILFSICSYVAENEDALSLVEGERVYVLESTNQEWWFVKKHLTEEKGWVPAVYLRDEASYALYVQKKLHEKIDKLPVFKKPEPGDATSAPKFIEKLQPKHVPDGATVQFECQVEGNPRPQITWFRQTAIIKPSQDFQIFYDEDNVATLIIREVFPEDAGTFTCVAKNAAGFASSTTELVVDAPLSEHGSDITGHSRRSLSRESSLADIIEGIPPTFSRKPKAICADENTNVELECRFVAVPEPEVSWYFNGKEVKSSETVTVITQSDMHSYSSRVELKKVTKKQDGKYTVVVKNREGEAKIDIVLKVKTGEEEPPQILEPLQDVTISEGDSVVLSTQITGNPAPTVKWFKDGKPVSKNLTKSQHGIHSLTLIKPLPSDSARYSVTATNNLGTVQTGATLIVEELPGPQAPLFVERFQELTVKEKGTIKLYAKVTGNPVPIITWFRNNKPLLDSPNIKETFDGENIELVIKNADSEKDAGDYKCVASNNLGTATHGARITVDVEKVTFTKKLKSKFEVDETETVTLECETSHTVSTKWLHNGKELSGMDHRDIVQDGRTHKLIIKRATPLDSGTYTCSVKNQETSTTVTVHSIKHDFLRKLEDLEVTEQETAVLEVEISSETKDVKWLKDGKVIKPSEKYVTEQQGPVRKLLIRSTSVHDEGEYTCSVDDNVCSAEVTVVELPPEIITKMQDQTISKGDKAVFDVELSKGDALVRWFKDDKELQFSEHVQLSIDGKKQKLKIYQTQLEDSGVYACRVGDQVSKAKLTVEEPAVEFVTRLPEVTLVPIKTDAIFVVELSKPDVEVKWLKKGKEITESDKYIITSSDTTRKLIIKKTTVEDQTDYTCVAANVKTTTKLKCEITKTPPKIEAHDTEFKVKTGQDVTFTIKFSSNQPVKEEWTVNGKVIQKSKRVSFSSDEESASLTIKQVEKSDVGNYTLRLVNNSGEASAELTLIMLEVPGAPDIPEVVMVTDNSATLHWKPPQFDGNTPITGYVFEHHDKDEFMVWKKIETTETTVKVTGLEKNHEVMFRVAAVNEVGVGPVSQNTRYVKIAAPLSTEAPLIQDSLKDVTVGLKKPLTLECVVSGTPAPEIKWFKNGTIIKSKSITYENNVAKYKISEALETTQGTYTCQAKNEAGSAETKCVVKVQDTPKLECDEALTNQTMRVKGQWKVEVRFSGFPRPEIKWQKNNDTITGDNRCKIYIDEESTTIAIYSVERTDSATYTVSATNSAGTATTKLVLRVIDKPGKPQGPIIVEEMDQTAATIQWKPPTDDGGLEISKYSIEKCDTNKMIWKKVGDVNKDISAYSVQKLEEDSEYMFRVTAHNPIGVSEPLESEPITIKCKFDKPSPPQGPLDVTDISDTAMTISWQPPKKSGGTVIIDYTVEMKESNSNSWRKVGVTSERHLHIEDLKKDESYDFRITARNRIGESVPYVAEESIIAGREITVPSAPTALEVTNISSKSVSLRWKQPEFLGNTELTGYVIEMQDSAQLRIKIRWEKVVTLEPYIMEYTIENLKEKSSFFFRVLAENKVGLSPPASTDVIALKTSATIPSPPTAPLETRVITANSVVLAWGIPETDGGSPVKGYVIAIKDKSKKMWMEVGKVKADVQKLTVKDLQENHEYMIRIFARNEVGLSEPLESEEPLKMQRPSGAEDADVEEISGIEKDTPSLSFSTETTTSWLREANMDADIRTYARGSLLRRSEYFFRIWYYARQLFK